MQYRIFDMRKSLFQDDLIVWAKSPKEAVKKAFPNAKVERRIEGCGVNIVVRSSRGSYLYRVEESEV